VPKAAAIIIGNEILSGKFADENGPWLAQECRRLGIDLIRIVVIPDLVDVIAQEVRRSAAEVDFVFTTGGIGPTHDDTTMEGIAVAFGEPLVRHPGLEGLIRDGMGDSVNEDALGMADVPNGTILWEDPGLRFPVVVCRNVVIFPGVPSFFQAKFRAVSHRFAGEVVQSVQFRTLERETSIANTLREAQALWPAVDIGSYPRFETQPPSVVVTMDSRDSGLLEECSRWLQERVSVTD